MNRLELAEEVMLFEAKHPGMGNDEYEGSQTSPRLVQPRRLCMKASTRGRVPHELLGNTIQVGDVRSEILKP